MFERKEEVTAKVNACFELLTQASKGDVVAWSDIEAAIGLPKSDGSFKYIQRAARQRLLKECGITTRPAHTVGVRLLTDGELVRDKFRMRRKWRQTSMEKKELEAANVGSLGMHDRKLLAARIDRVRYERREIRRSQNQFTLLGKREVMPRRTAV